MTLLHRLLHQKEDSPFEHTLWDRYAYMSLLRASGKIREVDERHRERYGRSFVADAAYALSGCSPDREDQMGRAWADVLESPAFSKLRQEVEESRAGRAVAVLRLAEMAREAFDAAKEGETSGRCENCGSERVVSTDEPIPDCTCQDCGRMWAAVPAKMEPQIEDGLPRGDDSDEDGTPVAVVFTGAEERVGEITDEAILVRVLAENMKGELLDERISASVNLVEQFDVEAFSRLLGWASRVIGAESRKHRGQTGEMTGYHRGGWSDRVVPDQMLAVAEGDLHALASLADNDLTSRDYRSEQPMGRGAVILCRDESGSMTVGEPSVHSTALSFELALAEVFNREGRDLVGIAWSSRGHRVHTYGGPGLSHHLSSFLGGMTDVRPALRAAVRVAEMYTLGCDILVLTDGKLQQGATFGRDVHDTLEAFRDGDGRCWAVSLNTVEKLDWTDGYITIDEIKAGEKLGALLQSITRPSEEPKQVRL